MGHREAHLGYEPALDGLRALAVVAVLAYHAGLRAVPGGFLGVDIFLVLSGYLITALVLEEWRRARSIHLGRFWERRARRLVPAVTVVVAVVVVHAAVTGATGSVRGDAVSTLGWVENWRLTLSDVSYFAVFGEASPLRHAWSLALEAQWYLVWPVLLAGLLRLFRGRTLPIAGVALGLAGASALLMAVWFDPAADPSRVYYGTDTRAHVLLVGAALALVLHRGGQARPGWVWLPAGVAGAGVVGLSVTNLADLDPRLYRGGFALVALGTAAVVAAALRPGSAVGRILRIRPLPALGRISYGVYLWHWPLYVWLGPGLATAGLAVAVAAASYHLVEQPVRRARGPLRIPALTFSLAGAAAVAAAALAFPVSTPVATPAAAAPAPPVTLAGPQPVSLPVPSDPTVAPTLEPVAGVSRVLVAGDSVAWTLAEHFVPSWVGGDFTIDYRSAYLGCGIAGGQPLNEGRPVLWADPACEEWHDRWQAGVEAFAPDTVIVVLGAWEVLDHLIGGDVLEAGSAAYEQYLTERLDRGLATLTSGGARVVILTAPCYRPEGEPPGRSTGDRADDGRLAWFNAMLREVSARHPGVRVADLRAFLCPGGEYDPSVRTDGVHVTAEGARGVWEWLAPQIGVNSGDSLINS